MLDTPSKFQKDPSITFRVILLIHRQTGGKRLIVCPKAKNDFNKTYFQRLSLQTEQMGGFMVKNTKTDK